MASDAATATIPSPANTGRDLTRVLTGLISSTWERVRNVYPTLANCSISRCLQYLGSIRRSQTTKTYRTTGFLSVCLFVSFFRRSPAGTIPISKTHTTQRRSATPAALRCRCTVKWNGAEADEALPGGNHLAATGCSDKNMETHFRLQRQSGVWIERASPT